MEHDFVLLSPEKTILTYRLAGIGSRILAHVLDAVIIGCLIFGSIMVGGIVALGDEGVGTAIMLMSSFLIPFLYFILLEWLWNGQTIGKKAAGLRVRLEDGTPITFIAALSRNLLRPADFLPLLYFVGIAAIFTNPKSQRIGDFVARTIVCHEKRPPVLYAMAPHVVGIHPFEDAVGELRGMTLEEYDTLRRFCDRFPELTPDTQRRLVNEVWEPIAKARKVEPIQNVHPLYLAEAAVMKYGRQHGLL